MKRPPDVQAGIGTKHDPSRIQQIHICPRNLRPDGPIDTRRTPTRDSAQDIGNRVRARKGDTFPWGQVELAKAMEQIRAPDLAHTGGDEGVRAAHRPARAETAVQGDLCLTEGGESTSAGLTNLLCKGFEILTAIVGTDTLDQFLCR